MEATASMMVADFTCHSSFVIPMLVPPAPVIDKELKEIFASGETISPDDSDINPLFKRHVAAYRFCAGLCKGKEVLDLGCGEGYGPYFLSQIASRVTGAEYQEPLVRYAQARYGGKNLHYQREDALNLSFPDASFDTIVSLQVMEHIKDYMRYLREIRRVMRPGATAIIVTPNCKAMLDGINPYHFKEFSAAEFTVAIREVFLDSDITGLCGSERYLKLKEAEQAYARKILALDFLRLRRFLPRTLLKLPYALGFFLVNRKTDQREKKQQTVITEEDFFISDRSVDQALELVGVCRKK